MKLNSVIVIFLGLLIWAGSLAIASATTITVKYIGSADFGSGPVGYVSGSLKPNPTTTPNTSVGVSIGGDKFKNINTADYFNAWCVDIFNWMSFSDRVTYTVGGITELTADFNSSRVDDLLKLANEVYAGVDTKEESAAFQEAIWAIMFSTKDANGHYQLNDGSFAVQAASGVDSIAKGWLDSLDSITPADYTGHYTLTYLYDDPTSQCRTQDVVVFTPAPVPEPSTFILFGIGLAGMAGVLVRRKY